MRSPKAQLESVLGQLATTRTGGLVHERLLVVAPSGIEVDPERAIEASVWQACRQGFGACVTRVIGLELPAFM